MGSHTAYCVLLRALNLPEVAVTSSLQHVAQAATASLRFISALQPRAEEASDYLNDPWHDQKCAVCCFCLRTA